MLLCCTVWEKTIKRSAITDFRFHDLRHSTASYLAMSGASLLEIADILGQDIADGKKIQSPIRGS